MRERVSHTHFDLVYAFSQAAQLVGKHAQGGQEALDSLDVDTYFRA